MQDLNTISRLNQEAIQRSIPDLLLRGAIVVAEYAGINFVGVHAFRGTTPEGDAGERARACFSEIAERNDSSNAKLYTPACCVSDPMAPDATVTPLQFHQIEPKATSRWLINEAVGEI